VIAFPGRSGSRDPARFLGRHGYGVLLFDRRGEGASEGDPNALGWGGGKDIEAAIAFLQKRPDVDPERIGGIGLSVGGEMLIETAAENEDLKAVVSEGAGIRSFREASELSGAGMWPQLLYTTAATVGTAVFSNHAPPPNLKDLVRRVAPRPVFLIYAERGQGGENLSADYSDAAGEPKQLWKTDSDHTGGYEAGPKEYERRVVRFFDARNPAAVLGDPDPTPALPRPDGGERPSLQNLPKLLCGVQIGSYWPSADHNLPSWRRGG
jgi:fermentation-respiration switch protein FrsA (DUF1100 family)